MASRSVNKVITFSGEIQIYVNRSQQLKAERLIRKVPEILTRGYTIGSRNFGTKLRNMVRKCLSTGQPPPGSGVSWPPHAVSTVKQLGEHTLLNWTGQYQRSVQIIETKRRVYVGLPITTKIRKSGKSSGKTLNQVAIMLEYGTEHIPPRALWNPAYRVLGGKAALKKEIRNQLRKEIRKYTK